MKTILNFISILVLILIATGCNDDLKYSPGLPANPNSQNVYFSDNNVLEQEFYAGELSEIVLTVKRGKKESAVTIPVIVEFQDNSIQIPESVSFSAGESDAEIRIRCSTTEAGSYSFGLKFEGDEYVNPYAANEGYASVNGTISISEYSILASDVTFTPGSYSGDNKPPFVPFKGKILKSSSGKYQIPDFLASGYPFTFSIDDDNNIVPDPDGGYHSTKDNRWYHYSANEDKSEYRIPCYIPCIEGATVDYITYIYFYTSVEGSSHYNFNLDITGKTGNMMGYARFGGASSSGRIMFEVSW